LESVLDLLGVRRSLRVEASPVVEVSAFSRMDGSGMLIGLANLSGQNGRAVHEHLPVYDLRLQIPGLPGAVRAESLQLGELACERAANGDLVVHLPRLELLDLVRIT
jgi:hypothetical protein